MLLVHGNWASWGDWTACSTTCGPDGMREKNRTCTDPAPMYDGDQCNSTLPDGVEFKSESCNTDILCPGLNSSCLCDTMESVLNFEKIIFAYE